MKAAGAVLLFIACVGVAHAVTYTSLEEAVQKSPQLSVLTERIDAFPAFANQVMASSFVGTLFAPMDSALKPIDKFASMLLSNPSTATDMLGLFVVPGAPLTLANLKDGMKLTTLNNQQVTVNIKTAADGQPIYYINQARIASGNIYAGQSIIHQMAGVIVAPSKQLLLNAALRTAGWSDNNPPATVDLSPNGPEQQVVAEPAAEAPAAEQPAPTTSAATPAPSDTNVPADQQQPSSSDTDITYEEHPTSSDTDISYEYGGDAGAEPAHEAPVPIVPVTDAEPVPAPPAKPATPTPTTAPTPATPTTTAPAQQQQPSVPVTVVPAPSTPQQQTDSSITLEAGKADATTASPAPSSPNSGTSKPPAATTTTPAAATPAPASTKPTTTTTTVTTVAATPAAATTATGASTGLPAAKTTSASTSVVVSAVAAVVPAVLALLMLA